MKAISLIIVILFPLILAAQSGVSVTGRVSLNVENFDYDPNSTLKPDSIPDEDYSKSSLIPGLKQKLDIALFARTQKLDITLLGDIRNDEWNTLAIGEFSTVERLTLSAQFKQNELVLGDYFMNVSELFLQSLQIRGAKVALHAGNLWNTRNYVKATGLYGLVQKAFPLGARLKGTYRQYETSGLYKRMMGSAMADVGIEDVYRIGMRYLYADDDANSIENGLNEPLTNQSMGAVGEFYLFKRRLNFFGEAYQSKVDSIETKGVTDRAIKSGVDLTIKNFRLTGYYQYLGYDYYSAGYPYLRNDKDGYRLIAGYNVPDWIILTAEFEQYKDNLKNLDTKPTTDTQIGIFGFTTSKSNYPELTLRYGFQNDLSNTVMIEDTIPTYTNKKSVTYEGRLSFRIKSSRFSFSTIYIDLDDRSLLYTGEPLGTSQLISSFNAYINPVQLLFISGGLIYSELTLTNGQINKNIYAYESSRWDIIPMKLRFNTNISYVINDAIDGGIQDMLSDYDRLGLNLSFEYFFTPNISLKVIGGTDSRKMWYTKEMAMSVITDPDYGPTYFNMSESYDALIYGAEFNWIF
jgi:hypothetical protein